MKKISLSIPILFFAIIAFSQEKEIPDKPILNQKYYTETAVFSLQEDGLFLLEHTNRYDNPKGEKEEVSIVIQIYCPESVLNENSKHTLPDSNFVFRACVFSFFDNKVEEIAVSGVLQVIRRTRNKITVDLNLTERIDEELINQTVTFKRKKR